MTETNVDEGKEPVVEEIQPIEGKLPETIPYSKYIGIKEAWGKTKEKVASLEEQLKGAISTEELTRLKEELDTTKTNLQTATDELKGVKDRSASEKRDILAKRGVPEDNIKAMSEEQLDAAVGVLEHIKPKSDLSGGGGGSGGLSGSPMELARQAYTK